MQQSNILATLCYIFNGEEVLMIKHARGTNKGMWNGVGGKFNPGESPFECVKREVYEETGLKIMDPVLKGILIFPEFENLNSWYVFVFVAKKFRGKIKTGDEGQLKWVSWRNLFKLKIYEGDRVFLRWVRNKKFFVAKFIYRNKRLVEYELEKFTSL